VSASRKKLIGDLERGGLESMRLERSTIFGIVAYDHPPRGGTVARRLALVERRFVHAVAEAMFVDALQIPECDFIGSRWTGTDM
jgi:hypothetical protein